MTFVAGEISLKLLARRCAVWASWLESEANSSDTEAPPRRWGLVERGLLVFFRLFFLVFWGFGRVGKSFTTPGTRGMIFLKMVFEVIFEARMLKVSLFKTGENDP